MLSNLEQNLIKKIRKEKIKPFSKSFFVFKKLLFWFFILVFLFISSLSLSVMALIIKYGDWDIYYHLGFSPSVFYIKAFPYFWLVALISFLSLSLLKSKKADIIYSYNYYVRLIVALLITISLASISYFSGLSQMTENYLSHKKIYLNVNYLRSSWQQPEQGLVAGIIYREGNKFKLEDLQAKKWELIIPSHNFIGQEFLKEGAKVKIIGQISDLQTKSFVVEEVRTWLCGCPRCSYMINSCSNCRNNNCSDVDVCSFEIK